MTTSRRSRYAGRHPEERAVPFFHRTRDTTVQDIGLYTLKLGLKPEGGPFSDDRYERLGAVGVLKVTADIPFRGVGYRFSLFENPHAHPTAALPPGICSGWPRYSSSGRVA